MDGLDIVLVVLAVGYALAGYRQGFVVGCASTLGLLGGGLAAVKAVPVMLGTFRPGLGPSLTALLLVLVAALVGQAVGALLGRQIRKRISWRPARLVDAVSGAALSVAAMLLIAWVLGVVASGAQLHLLNRQVYNSVVLGAVNRALPGGSQRVMSAFKSIAGSASFPQYLEPFVPEHITPVPRPSSGVTARPAVVRDGVSVVKVIGQARSCSRTLEGSGFVYAPHRVMTNAHVVAGVTSLVVEHGDHQYRSRVVYYDPSVDVAVLSVPALNAPSLQFGAPLHSKQSAAVIGYPENGPLDFEPARIRQRQTLRSPDIYGNGTVDRATYSIRSLVRRGNSGGPLVDPSGKVVGVVFAASSSGSGTGYALTNREVRTAVQKGRRAHHSTLTGPCAP